MDKKAKVASRFFLAILVLAVLLLVYLAFADTAVVLPTSINVVEDAGFILNFSVNDSSTSFLVNITQANITFPSGVLFNWNSNGTTSKTPLINNSDNVLVWLNTTYSLLTGFNLSYFWINATFPTSGQYNISVITLFNNGAINYSNVSITVNDTTSPVVTVLYPANGTIGTATPSINVSLNEAGTCNISLTGGKVNYTMTPNATLTGFNFTNASSFAEGSVNTSYYCKDFSNNTNYAHIRLFTVDTTYPNVTIYLPTNVTNTSSTIGFNVTTSEYGSCLFTLDGGKNNVTMQNATGLVSGLNEFNYTNGSIADGNYTMTAYCNDTAGNKNYTTTRTFSIAVAPYSLTFNRNQINWSNGKQDIQLNFSVVSEAAVGDNVTLVNISLIGTPFASASIISGTNTTTATGAFSNYTVSNVIYLIWNTGASGFQWGLRRDFLVNVSFVTPGLGRAAVNITRSIQTVNSTSNGVTINFGFSGAIKNETANLVANATVYTYSFAMSSSGPPTQTLVSVINSSEDGTFRVEGLNASVQQYVMKILYRNKTSVVKTSSILPAFPTMMYYGLPTDPNALAFMKTPAVNGSVFYLQPASVLRLNATNGSDGQLFGYEVFDTEIGMPVDSNVMASSGGLDVAVPAGRNYTVMLVRSPGAFAFDSACTGGFMNASTCPTTPVSNSTHGTLTEGKVVSVTPNLVVSNVRLTGCIAIASKANINASGTYNITNIVPRLVPWAGFVPPMSGDSGNINVTTNIFYHDSRCNSTKISGGLAWYNISLMGSYAGVGYMLEFYAKNDSFEWLGAGGYLVGFQNITMSNQTEQNFNITLQKPVGAYWANGLTEVNISKMRINIQNSSGAAITNDLHAEVQIKNSATGTVHYIIETLTNGTFYLPIMNNSDWAKVSVYPNDGPPYQKTLNLSVHETNITLVTMTGGDTGFRKVLPNGTVVQMNVTSLPVNLSFYRNTDACTVVSPASSCLLTSMTAEGFNPFAALVAGKVNMQLQLISSGVTMLFVNYDMFSAQQPPMNSIMNDNATTADSSAQQQAWRFGSYVSPDVYDYVIVGMPYSGTQGEINFLNESWTFNMTLPYLYDENMNVVFNRSRGDTTASLTDEFSAYATGSYANYLTDNGTACNTSDSTFSQSNCYLDTVNNMMWIKLPHFSSMESTIKGNQPAASTTAGSTTGAGPTTEKKTTFSWEELEANTPIKIVMTDLTYGVKTIGLELSEDVTDPRLYLVYHGEENPVTENLASEMYRYFEVRTTNIGNSQIEKAVIEAMVERTWCEERGLDSEDLVVYRYNDDTDKWEQLPSVFSRQDASHYYINGTTTHFSYFAVGEKGGAKEAAEEGTTQPSPSPSASASASPTASATQTPPAEGEGKVPWWVWLIIGVVVIAVVVLIVVLTSKKGHKKKW